MTSKMAWICTLMSVGCLAGSTTALGQVTPYIGFVYPAGGQQGTTSRVRLGGQRIDGVTGAIVSGAGVSCKLVEYRRKLNPQEITLLREQVRELKRGPKKKAPATLKLIATIEQRISEYVNRPASTALSSIAIVDVTIAPNAAPGSRELRLITPRGVTNPMIFHVDQLPEVNRKPMRTAPLQVLGKEYLALRKRPPDEVEQRVSIPCTMNGQIASGEVNRYRFEATKGQQLVIVVNARQLIPYIADAVPGWFQPVLALYDAAGKEVAFDDDFRFKPDPIVYYKVPKSGEYVLAINDAIYRGREDFVYRIRLGELPFITAAFPLGGPVGKSVDVEIGGWNLTRNRLIVPDDKGTVGITHVTTNNGRLVSNSIPFARDTLPECLDQESPDASERPQAVALPIIVNGRMDFPNDIDVFQINGRAGETIVAEVFARRLDSPIDSFLKLTDTSGKVIAFNDDHEDPGSGLNTHHADSYLRVTLPADGRYLVQLNDTAGNGGPAYAYRLRISAPLPDFALRVVPSSVAVRSKGSGNLLVHAIRKDGFTGPITISLRDPPRRITMRPTTLPADKDQVRVRIAATLASTEQPVDLVVQGSAKINGRTVTHDAVPAEDRMQAFLWRHLVPAQDLKMLVYNPSYTPPPKRVHPPKSNKQPVVTTTKKQKNQKASKVTFTKRQVAGRLRQLEALYQEGLLTDAFYDQKVAECEALQ